MDPRLAAHRPALVYDPQEAYPEVVTCSRHETGEARPWAKGEHMKSDDKGRAGTAHRSAPPGGAVARFIRASAYDTVRRRSDPVDARVGGSE